jgi:hypothetical protein
MAHCRILTAFSREQTEDPSTRKDRIKRRFEGQQSKIWRDGSGEKTKMGTGGRYMLQ